MRTFRMGAETDTSPKHGENIRNSKLWADLAKGTGNINCGFINSRWRLPEGAPSKPFHFESIVNVAFRGIRIDWDSRCRFLFLLFFPFQR